MLQLLTPDRHGRVVDALVKTLGGISGIGVGQLLSFLLRFKSARPAVQSDFRFREPVLTRGPCRTA